MGVQDDRVSRFSKDQYSLEKLAVTHEPKTFKEKVIRWMSLKRLSFFQVLDPLGISKINGSWLLGEIKKSKVRTFLALSDSAFEADVLIVRGPITEALFAEIYDIYQKMPSRKWVVFVGAKNTRSHFSSERPCYWSDELIPIDVYIPGGRPSSKAILEGMELLYQRVEKGVCAHVG
ncbi:hypothetical protein HBN50_10445 [Halobacteriovorax sp. GB3]|uniref:NADH-quinone oxidoreductase subunit B family protein n=1 Tax=Halobacteriovorax sp. GB3 TaxID=2719615 RepID=UPI0023628B83|nr:hypothetical protein [Halobacteriovorax sp. GB3]MDD0853521.1 hypothetical protein [Halobacteriovorax sp. GB3]